MSNETSPTQFTIHPQSSYKELYDYFLKKLPENLPFTIYKAGLSCYGFARLLVEELGGSTNTRIYSVRWNEDREITFSEEDYDLSHAYVVKNNAELDEFAYNNNLPPLLTNADVIQFGTDVTEEIMNEPWSAL